MKPSTSHSASAQEALKLIEALQARFVAGLEAISEKNSLKASFEPVTWLRDEGRHGGGTRYQAPAQNLYNRGSVNQSQVHYDDEPSKKLASATALSTIIHPQSPHAPSVHIHISWTEMKDGSGYWRLMADLNPSLPNCQWQDDFRQILTDAAGPYFDEGSSQGDQYFMIPALGRYRGVEHFYLENFSTGNSKEDLSFAKNFGEAVIDGYCRIFDSALEQGLAVTKEQLQQQLAYHTLYFFQVLTLDRGTTSGLMIHSDNDVGTLGSIPSHIDPELLISWKEKVPETQKALVQALWDCLPKENPCLISESVKSKLAQAIREFYREKPEALDLQARGRIIPPTVANHGAGRSDEL